MADTNKKGVLYYLEQILEAIYALGGTTAPADDNGEYDD